MDTYELYSENKMNKNFFLDRIKKMRIFEINLLKMASQLRRSRRGYTQILVLVCSMASDVRAFE